jgi:hypothetical protein
MSERAGTGERDTNDLALTSLLLDFPQNRLETRTMSFDKLPKETLEQICEEVGKLGREGSFPRSLPVLPVS